MKRFALLALTTAIAGTTALADDVTLPSQITFTGYGAGSFPYSHLLAVGNELKEDFGTNLRIIPGKNDISRMIPLRDGIADYCSCTIASYYAQEGAAVFAAPEWGPQRVFNIFNNAKGANGLGFVVAGDAGVSSLADLRGKRVATVVASPAVEYNTTGFLAFADMTWDDVQRIEFSGHSQAYGALIAGQVDAVFGNTFGMGNEQLAASPHGIFYPGFPHDDQAGWDRMLEVVPYFNKRMVSAGVQIEKNSEGKTPYEGAGFPFPLYVTYGDKSEDEVYNLLKAIFDRYDRYKDAAPLFDGYQADRQVLTWVMPYHPGAIKLYKEAGLWGDAEEAHNQTLLKRQDILANAWTEFMATDAAKDKDGFADAWMSFRADKLKAAELPVVF
jgi:TRAP transporter TAXI family solute receptor